MVTVSAELFRKNYEIFNDSGSEIENHLWNEYGTVNNYIYVYHLHRKCLSGHATKRIRASPPEYYLAIVTSFNNDAVEFINGLFEASFEKPILNIDFLLPHQNQSTWLLTTFMPFLKSCNSLQRHDIALLSERNYSLHGPIDLVYPKKLKDFRQCPVTVAIFDTPPFLIVRSDENGYTYDGIDTRILAHLAKKFNFKLIYRMPRDNQDRGTIYSNGTVTGCIKMVVTCEYLL